MSGHMPPEPPPPMGEADYSGGGRSRPRMNSAPSQMLTLSDVKGQLEAMSPEIARTLPPGISPERFLSVSMTAIQTAPKLLECQPQSLFNACMKAAQDGLLPDGREGVIVPRNNPRTGQKEATWQPMLAGIQAKAKRRGNVSTLVAHVVYDGEIFEHLLGDEERITHKRDMSKVHKGNEIGVYAIATMKDGSKEREAMTWEQVQQVRQASSDPNGIPWTKWTDEMAKKSCIRRLSKRLPSLDDGDDDLRQSIERVDELYPFGKPSMAPMLEAEPPAPEAEVEPPVPQPTERKFQPQPKQNGGAGQAFRTAGLPPKVEPQPIQEHDPQTGEIPPPPPDAEWISQTIHILTATKGGPEWLDLLEACCEACPSLTAWMAINGAETVTKKLNANAVKAETKQRIRTILADAEKHLLTEMMPMNPPRESPAIEESEIPY